MRLALIVVLLALPRTAAAWVCGDTPPATVVSPGASPAPLNARIRLRLEHARVDDADLRAISLRPHVLFRLTRMPGRIVELVPKTRLRTNTEYTVLWPARTEPIGRFRTGDAPDTIPPELPASLPTSYVDLGWVLHHYKQDRPATIPPARLRAWPYGFVDVRGARDDRTPEAELWFGSWLVEEAPSQQRAVFRLARSGGVRVGDPEPPYECSTAFEFPFPKRAPRVLMAIAAFDLAGNASAPRYFVLDRALRRWKEPVLR
jgi:hypothetical protein